MQNTKKIRLAIAGYGNIGRGAELAVSQNDDMVLTAVLTRRNPSEVKIITPDVPVINYSDMTAIADKVDVVILCSGSATDLPEWGPRFAEVFNTVDSFDTHAKIPDYFAAMDAAAKKGGKVALISAGWDPGLFSINRTYAEAFLPRGTSYTFWGKGVSAGHSDALRRIDGVRGAIQYTVPVEKAVASVRAGNEPVLSTRDKHTRLCFVVAEDGADRAKIESEIKNMPNYFSDYDTTVNFISEEELRRDHSGMPHGGFVIRGGNTASGLKQVIEYGLKLDSNPEFTSSVLVACARAVSRLSAAATVGACSMLDLSPTILSRKSPQELRAELL